MIDLKFSYTNANGKRITKEYNTIMDFIDFVDLGEISSTILYGFDVVAEFFENPLLSKRFKTVDQLYSHCIAITA